MNVLRFIRPWFFLLAFLPAAGVLSADDTRSIITEGSVSIQFFSTSAFTGWPGVSGLSPVEVSAEAERIRLIWPGSIIDLNTRGETDSQTLLTLFATRTASWGTGNWTPRDGVVCSDGFWRGFSDQGFTQLNLTTGAVKVRKWEGSPPDSIYPAYDGNLLIFSGGKVILADFNSGEIRQETRIPSLSMLAVSTRAPLAAWQESSGGSLHIIDFDTLKNLEIENPPGKPWSMSWAGDSLVIACPGELCAIDIQGGEPSEFSILEDKRLPERWYRIRGGKNYLLIQSPEEGNAAILTPEETGPVPVEDSDFQELLKKYSLSAGDELTRMALLTQADRYYSWVMTYIREFRSRYPLEEIWPNLESEITRRRNGLR